MDFSSHCVQHFSKGDKLAQPVKGILQQPQITITLTLTLILNPKV